MALRNFHGVLHASPHFGGLGFKFEVLVHMFFECAKTTAMGIAKPHLSK